MKVHPLITTFPANPPNTIQDSSRIMTKSPTDRSKFKHQAFDDSPHLPGPKVSTANVSRHRTVSEVPCSKRVKLFWIRERDQYNTREGILMLWLIGVHIKCVNTFRFSSTTGYADICVPGVLVPFHWTISSPVPGLDSRLRSVGGERAGNKKRKGAIKGGERD